MCVLKMSQFFSDGSKFGGVYGPPLPPPRRGSPEEPATGETCCILLQSWGHFGFSFRRCYAHVAKESRGMDSAKHFRRAA